MALQRVKWEYSLMPDSRWAKVSEIFEGALALAPELRSGFVAQRCGNDEALRQEVEMLIASHQKAGAEEFLGAPAAEVLAPLLDAEEHESETPGPRLQRGQQVGHYIINQLIGSGGMGEVYRATDTRLDRTVALKILPADVTTDQRRMLRFKQEARAVSALNQPNILTIYEFGEVENLHFLAAEFIEGETLRRQLSSSRMKLTKVLEIVTQVCAALEAAHEATIVHRDIKPENIMIRWRDGVVKVLDFGLAKLSHSNVRAGSTTNSEAATAVKTVPGSVMGTFAYMSPEQAQGRHVDERTDIWSIGVVIYEMVAGRTPFAGPTNSHTVVSILEKEPEKLSESAEIQVPDELDRIVRKALAKNVNDRYQTIKDLLIDLRNLRKQLDLQSENKVTPSHAGKETEAELGRSTSGQQLIANKVAPIIPLGKGRIWWLILVVAVLAAGIVIAALIKRSFRSMPYQASVPVVERRLNYWIEVQKYRDGKPFEEPFTLAREINFEKDYRVRLHVKAPQAGYLYVLNDGPQGNTWLILFPSTSTNQGSAFLAENKVTSIPEASWFAFDSERGAEKVWLVWSSATVPELEAVRRFANTKDKGVIKAPELNREVQNFVIRNSEPKPAIEKNVDGKETLVRSTRDIVVHVITLEHN